MTLHGLETARNPNVSGKIILPDIKNISGTRDPR
jgi:hypothetical protein